MELLALFLQGEVQFRHKKVAVFQMQFNAVVLLQTLLSPVGVVDNLRVDDVVVFDDRIHQCHIGIVIFHLGQAVGCHNSVCSFLGIRCHFMDDLFLHEIVPAYLLLPSLLLLLFALQKLPPQVRLILLRRLIILRKCLLSHLADNSLLLPLNRFFLPIVIIVEETFLLIFLLVVDLARADWLLIIGGFLVV